MQVISDFRTETSLHIDEKIQGLRRKRHQCPIGVQQITKQEKYLLYYLDILEATVTVHREHSKCAALQSLDVHLARQVIILLCKSNNQLAKVLKSIKKAL